MLKRIFSLSTFVTYLGIFGGLSGRTNGDADFESVRVGLMRYAGGKVRRYRIPVMVFADVYALTVWRSQGEVLS